MTRHPYITNKLFFHRRRSGHRYIAFSIPKNITQQKCTWYPNTATMDYHNTPANEPLSGSKKKGTTPFTAAVPDSRKIRIIPPGTTMASNTITVWIPM